MRKHGDGAWSWQLESERHPEWEGASNHASPNTALLAAARWVKNTEERESADGPVTVWARLCHHEDGNWGVMVHAEPRRPEWEFGTCSFDDPVSALVAASGAIGSAEPQTGSANAVETDIARAQAAELPDLGHAQYLLDIERRVEDL